MNALMFSNIVLLLHTAYTCTTIISNGKREISFAMATTAAYSPVRSAVILTLSFLLPLLASLYSDGIYSFLAASRPSSTSHAPLSNAHNYTIEESPILARQQSVGTILARRDMSPVLRTL
jgi:hypothetical protein